MSSMMSSPNLTNDNYDATNGSAKFLSVDANKSRDFGLFNDQELSPSYDQTLEDILNEDDTTPSEIDFLVAHATRSQSVTSSISNLEENYANSFASTSCILHHNQNDSIIERSTSKSPMTVCTVTSTSSTAYEDLEIASATELRALSMISATLAQALNGVNSGYCSCVAVSRRLRNIPTRTYLIAVGTSQGIVFIFDAQTQRLIFTFNAKHRLSDQNASHRSNLGSVSTLTFSPNTTKLVVAYAKGAIELIDTRKGRSLTTIDPDKAHQAGRGVLQVHFLNNSNMCTLLDSGGNVFVLKFTNSLSGAVNCKMHCIFSGCHGEVCALAPLYNPNRPPVNQQEEQNIDLLTRFQMLAIATLTKCVVLSLNHNPEVVYATTLPGVRTSVPLLAWHWVRIQHGKAKRVLDPVLAFCRGDTIYFTQLHFDREINKFQSFDIAKIKCNFEVINMCWVNDRTIAALSVDESMHIYEVSRGKQIDKIDLAAIKLVYATPDYKGLPTGGNVSCALTYIAEKATYSSMFSCTLEDSVLILGVNALYALFIRTWEQRVKALVDAGNFAAAIQLATDLYTGKVRLSRTISTARHSAQVCERIISLCCDYVKRAMSTDLPKNIEPPLLLAHYRQILPVVVDSLVTIKAHNVLYGQIYELVSRSRSALAIYLECLESPILDDQLGDIQPMLAQQYLAHLADEGIFASFESSILHMPIETLDIHQVMSVCDQQQLWDGIIYVHNKALADYISPLKMMFKALRRVMHHGTSTTAQLCLSDIDTQLGNKCLLYLSCCLTGVGYSNGLLPGDQASQVVRNTTHAILTPHDPTLVVDDTQISPQRTDTYPYLRTLLQFDTRECLNVLSLAFATPEFHNDMWGRHVTHQCTDILSKLALEFAQTQCQFRNEASHSNDSRLTLANCVDIGAFITFIARCMATDQASISWQALGELVCASVDACSEISIGSFTHDDREQATIDLLDAYEGLRQTINEEQLLTSAKRAKFFRLCERIYMERGDFDSLIDCYILDKRRQIQVFACVTRLLANKNNQAKVQKSIIERLPKLSQISLSETATICIALCNDLTSLTANNLAKRLINLFEHFDQDDIALSALLLEINEQRMSDGATLVMSMNDNSLFDRLCEMLCAHADEDINGVNGSAHMLRIFHNTPTEVLDLRYQYLTSLAAQYNVINVRVALLEQRTLIDDANDLLIDELRKSSDLFQSSLTSNNLKRLITITQEYMQFCARVRDSEKSSRYWQSLFDALLSLPAEILKENNSISYILSQVVHAIVTGSAGSLQPYDVLRRLLNHASLRDCTYAEHKQLIEKMVDVFDYELVLVKSLVQCMRTESIDDLAIYNRHAARAAFVSKLGCTRCNGSFSGTDADRCLVFACGHFTHLPCMKGSAQQICFTCNGVELPPLTPPVTQETSTPSEAQYVHMNYSTNPFDDDNGESTSLETSQARRRRQKEIEQSLEHKLPDFHLNLMPPSNDAI